MATANVMLPRYTILLRDSCLTEWLAHLEYVMLTVYLYVLHEGGYYSPRL